jgi:oligoendopeptidase F
LSSCYHETGHAIHASSINPDLNYWEKYKFSMGVAEIFSILIESLTRNRLYLKDIGITNDKLLSDLIWRNKFMELFFVVFYAANSLMKMEYWNRNLSTYEASRMYEKLIKKYMVLKYLENIGCYIIFFQKQ